jgi:hypothetical protein
MTLERDFPRSYFQIVYTSHSESHQMTCHMALQVLFHHGIPIGIPSGNPNREMNIPSEIALQYSCRFHFNMQWTIAGQRGISAWFQPSQQSTYLEHSITHGIAVTMEVAFSNALNDTSTWCSKIVFTNFIFTWHSKLHHMTCHMVFQVVCHVEFQHRASTWHSNSHPRGISNRIMSIASQIAPKDNQITFQSALTDT